MKTFLLKSTLAGLFVTLALGVSAQSIPWQENPAYGKDLAEREKNAKDLMFFNEAFNNKDYDTALGYFRGLLQAAPGINLSLYTRGAEIYRSRALAAREKDPALFKAYLDTLMMVYDNRHKYFGDLKGQPIATVLTLKANDHLILNPENREMVRKLFQQAFALGGTLNPMAVNIYFNELVNDYKNDVPGVDAEMIMDEYEKFLPIFDQDPVKFADAKETFEALFIQSGVADCGNIEKLFRPRIEANPTDTATMTKCMALLQRARCNTDFAAYVGEKYYALIPSSGAALYMATFFENRHEYTKSLKYLNEAILHEKDPQMKSNLCVRIAAAQLGLNNPRLAADYSKQAIDVNPENGYAYMMLAQAYTMGNSACADFERRAVYWLVYDQLTRARALLAGDREQIAAIDQQMSTYRANFPSKEDCFFCGLQNGQTYDVKCGWITGRTTVRER